jgi:2-amino-4-hydroxy-6-hydroxymethyldihydropteridine diphosphokinase
MTEAAALCRGDTVYIALGSNLGDRDAHLAAAREALAALPGTGIIAVSDIEETAPIGPAGQGPYLNQVVAMHTSIEPLPLLRHLHDIERTRGRVRLERWGARTLDLDIVCYGGRQIADPDLVVPHPELPNREFWRREMAQAAGRIVPAVTGRP